jgi:hypothetical protein
MDIGLLDTKDYISAKKAVFAVSGVLLFVSQVGTSADQLTGQLAIIYSIAALLLEPLKIVLFVLMAFLIVRAFEVRLPIRKVLPEFAVGLLGALCFGLISIIMSS